MSQAKYTFLKEFRNRDPNEAQYDERLQALVAISNSLKQLRLRDLYTLWLKSPNAEVSLDCMRYYTDVQIEMFGLQGKCCNLPLGWFHDAYDLANRDQGSLLNDKVLKVRFEEMVKEECKYVIGGILKDGHWLSVVSLINYLQTQLN